MKKLVTLFLLSVFIFSIKSFGQTESRLNEMVTELYDSSHETYLKTNHKFFYYRQNGDTLSIIEKRYEPRVGEVMLWLGDFYEYDDENRLIKKVNKRYNPEVDLWISNYWVEYFYDDDNCIEREELIFNVGGLQDRWYFFIDEDCRKVEARETDEVVYNISETFSYPDEYKSLIVSRNELYQGTWNGVWQNEWIRNERGDLVKRGRLFKNDFGPTNDTAYYSLQVNEYDYIEDFFTGRLTSKLQKHYNNQSNLFLSPFSTLELRAERRYDYEYYCDGLVSKETLSILGEANPSSRILYFYEGKSDCFDFEQDLEMTISPNPSFGKIEIQSLIFESGDTELQVFTARGQLVLNKKISSRSHYQNVDLDFLRNGVYIIHLRSGKHFSTSKLVISE